MTFRKLVSILLVTYLPTVLMNMINQATNYITTEDKYSLILQTNITCMMVLASVYLSVSASLPTTSGPEWSSLIGPDPSRYSALIGGHLNMLLLLPIP